jgi:hypothetical protein
MRRRGELSASATAAARTGDQSKPDPVQVVPKAYRRNNTDRNYNESIWWPTPSPCVAERGPGERTCRENDEPNDGIEVVRVEPAVAIQGRATAAKRLDSPIAIGRFIDDVEDARYGQESAQSNDVPPADHTRLDGIASNCRRFVRIRVRHIFPDATIRQLCPNHHHVPLARPKCRARPTHRIIRSWTAGGSIQFFWGPRQRDY